MFKEKGPLSRESRILRILGGENVPETVTDLPNKFSLSSNDLHDIFVGLQETRKEKLEMGQAISMRRNKKLVSGPLIYGEEASISIISFLIQGLSPLSGLAIVWHSHTSISPFSDGDVFNHLCFNASPIQMIAATNNFEKKNVPQYRLFAMIPSKKALLIPYSKRFRLAYDLLDKVKTFGYKQVREFYKTLNDEGFGFYTAEISPNQVERLGKQEKGRKPKAESIVFSKIDTDQIMEYFTNLIVDFAKEAKLEAKLAQLDSFDKNLSELDEH